MRSSTIDVAKIRERFAQTEMPLDPAIPCLPDATRWPKEFVNRARLGMTPAGVLIGIFERDRELSVLFTERSAELKLHAGQISFPGGRMEANDRDIAATALRESEEEVGIAPELVEVVGFLPPSATVTGYSVTPVIGLLSAAIDIEIDRNEVESTFEVPLNFLLDASNEVHTVREFQGLSVPIVEFNHAGRRIWGATASMLMQFRKRIYYK